MIKNHYFNWKDWKKLKNKTIGTSVGRDYIYKKVECDGDKFIVDIWEPIKIGWKFLAR